MAPGTLGVVVVVVILSLVTLSYAATVPLSKDSILTSTAKIFTTTERQTSRSSITTKSGSTETLLVKGAQNETEVKADERAEIPLKRLHNIVHGIHLVALNFEHVKYPLVFTLVVIFAGLSKILFHHLHFLSSKIPESCFSGVGADLEFFSPDQFFFFLLPPIILESAFSLHDRTFAENIGSVLLLAVFGTVLSCFSVGLTLFGLYKAGAMEEINCTLVQILVFSSLIVAVDPVAVLAVFQEVGVNNVLYFLVFGESLLNDGVTVVLYNVMQKLNRMDEISPVQIVLGFGKFIIVVVCGFAIGVFCGILSSVITRFSNAVKVVEPLLIFGFAYLSYVLSELFEVSGIISMIGCGIVQAHYSFLNITTKSRSAVKFFAKVMSLSCLINKLDTDRVRKIKYDEMFMMSYGGLRGAVCFSLVALLDESEYPMKNMFVTTTLFVIFFTVFIQGGTVKWLVQLLSVKLEERSKNISLNQELTEHVSDHLLAGIESIVGRTGSHYIKEQMNLIDDTYIRPKLQTNATKSDLGDITRHYEKLLMKEHYKHLELSGAKLPSVTTEIRHLDSKTALENLESKEELELPTERDDVIKKTRTPSNLMWKKAVSKVKAVKKLDDIPADKRRVRKLVRKNIERSKQRPEVLVFRINSMRDRKGSFINHMRQKYKKNEELGQLKSTTKLNQSKTHSKTSLSVPEASATDYDYPSADDVTECGIKITVENVDDEVGEDIVSERSDARGTSDLYSDDDAFKDF